MRYSYDGTDRADRLARGAASVLLVLAVVSLTAAWQLHQRTQEHLAAVRGDNPADVVLVPSAPAAPSVGSSTAPDRSSTPTHLYVPAIQVDTAVVAKPTQRTRDP